MNHQEIVALLTSYSFTDLKLIKDEETKLTYKFAEYNPKKITKLLGEPEVAGGGKVEVFQIPGVGKIGVSPSNSMVRAVLNQKVDTGSKVNDSHLGQKGTTDELALAYKQAQGNPKFRLPFAKKLWTYFNKTKFADRLTMPKLEVSTKPSFGMPGGLRNARGVYQTGRNFGPGIIWLADFLFNSSEAFTNEILLHEMCHQAAWEIDHDTDRSQKGHGPVWQRWMVHVGLDPRRYDPTDDYEYKSGVERAKEDSELSTKYGPRASPSVFKELRKAETPVLGPCVFEYKGRALQGVLVRTVQPGYEYAFDWKKDTSSALTWFFKKFPVGKIYTKG